MNKPIKISFLNKIAESAGLDIVGAAKAESLSKEAFHRLKEWLDKGYHADMNYLTENLNLRSDPALILSNCKSIIVFAVNYFYQENQKLISQSSLKISLYAQGIDYHAILKKKLKIFTEIFHSKTDGKVQAYVDTGPVQERYWAVRAGLGGIGKNCCLITSEFGSRVFLAVCLTDVVFETYSEPIIGDLCKDCSLCVDACPTGALNGNKTLDAGKCIAYLTVEHKDSFDVSTPEWKDWIWGCDVCQNVCPHNQKIPETQTTEFQSQPQVVELMNGCFDILSFNKDFAETSLRRGGKARIPRNIEHIQKKKSQE